MLHPVFILNRYLVFFRYAAADYQWYKMKIKILNILRNASNYISGEAISKELQISRAAIWKKIKQLQQEGYVITAVTQKGYKLEAVPDRLYPHELTFEFDSTLFTAENMHYFAETDSTISRLKLLAQNAAAEGTVAIAESQTNGRGRYNRHWYSPSGKNIYCSVLFRPKIELVELPKLTIMTAVAITEVLTRYCVLPIQIKWPNDILVDNKKLCGILTEMDCSAEQVNYIIIGFGINCNLETDELPDELCDIATSLKIANQEAVARIALCRDILLSIEKYYEIFTASGSSLIIETWKKYSMSIGKKVIVQNAGGEYEGSIIDIDVDGFLLIEKEDGSMARLLSGDLLFID